jgi:hypothetical protein
VAKRTPMIKNRRYALVLGYGGIIVGAVALYDAYEKRGKERPFLARFLPN